MQRTERRSLVASASVKLCRNSLKEMCYLIASFTLKIKGRNQKVCKKKYLAWVFGVDRKSVIRDRCSASLGNPRDADP